jgi:hypothetical protein
MGGANRFGIEIQAVASYRRRALLVGAKTHNVLVLGWFRTAANFAELFDVCERRVR